MSWFTRTGAVRPLARMAKADSDIQKANAPLIELGSSYDMERDAILRRSRTVAEIEADHDLLMGSMGCTRQANMTPGARQMSKHDAQAEYERAQAKTAKQIREQADDDDDNAPPATAPVRDTKVKPGTSNVTHKPSEEGVYQTRDMRSAHTIHHVNRKMNRPGEVQKSERVAFQKVETNAAGKLLDLANPLSWMFRPATLKA